MRSKFTNRTKFVLFVRKRLIYSERKRNNFFFRIVCKSRDYQNLFQCLYQNYSKFFFFIIIIFIEHIIYPPIVNHRKVNTFNQLKYLYAIEYMMWIILDCFVKEGSGRFGFCVTYARTWLYYCIECQ